MIDKHKLRAARERQGLSQEQVGKITKERFGVGSQQGYAKLESGRAPTSRYLAYYCTVLDVPVSDIDSGYDGDVEASIASKMHELLNLPESARIEIAQKLLASLSQK